MKKLLISVFSIMSIVGCKSTISEPAISIHHAAHIGDIEMVREQLAAGIDPNSKNLFGYTPLFQARSSMDMITLLVDAGADINDTGKGSSALHIHHFSNDMIRFLLDMGCDINAYDELGDTVLHKALDGPFPRSSHVKALLDGGADVNASDKNGMTPMDRFLEGKMRLENKRYKKEIEKVKGLLLGNGAKTSKELKIKEEADDNLIEDEPFKPREDRWPERQIKCQYIINLFFVDLSF